MSLSPKHKEIVDATVPAVAANIETITSVFYPRMFKENPEVLAFFNQSNQRETRQPQALAGAVVAAVSHLDNLAAIMPAIEVMAHKHCALGVLPEHYKIVHDNFIAATAEVLGDAVTADVAEAWSAVLMIVARALIGVEAGHYAEAAARPGGWEGVKPLRITRVRDEPGGRCRSLWLAHVDDSAAPVEFTPGQYLTVCENPGGDGAGPFAPRHYTISSDTELRITVKAIGEMSNHLFAKAVGDTVLCRPPFGTGTAEEVLFFKSASGPVVFVSGGIGVTPVRALAAECVRKSVRFASVHAGHADTEHPLCDEIEALGGGVCVKGDRSVLTGESIAAAARAAGAGNPAEAIYFISGPVEMMKAAAGAIREQGVPGDRIKWTAFGPAVREI